MIGQLIDAILRRISIIIAWFISGYIDEVEHAAYTAGYNHGQKEGHNSGLIEGKRIWEIKDDRCPTEPQPIDRSIYGPRKFIIAEEMREAMRIKTDEAVEKRIVDAPTNDQWDMIFSDSPATCVIAGAGSGKSTTLVLRVIFMVLYLNIRPDEMTVVSFTKASCHELRNSLIKVFFHWTGQEMPYSEAKQLVRTFHSALYRTAKKVFHNVQFFENIGSDKDGLSNEKYDEEEQDDMDDLFSAIKLKAEQVDMLKDAYIDLFQTNETFKKHVGAMLEIEATRSDMLEDNSNKQYKKPILRSAQNRDIELVRKVNRKIKENGYWPDFGITEGPFKAFNAEGFNFYSNAIVTATGMPIFFGGRIEKDSLFDSEEVVGEDENGQKSCSIHMALGVKRNIISRWCGKKYQYISGSTAIQRLKLYSMLYLKEKQIGEAPIFDIKLDGEIKSSPIYAAFFIQASFIESMGLEVGDAIKRLEPFRTKCLEYYFCCALGHYWIQFNKSLHERKLMTFNRAFLLLSSEHVQAKQINEDILQPLRHLLIDEFQDISPQIVNWLQNHQRQLVASEKKDQNVSIMAIGDDWQSIYGWRGSAPDFFIKFDDYFPSQKQIGKAKICRIEENFRSIETIVRQAEIVLRPVRNKTNKKSTANRRTESGDHGIVIKTCDSYEGKSLDQISEFILEQLEFASRIKDSHKNKVIVMTRSNYTLRKLESRVLSKVGKRSGVVFYTYHRAKGLQGEVAVMVEDCDYNQNHKFRNRVYAASGLFSSEYDYDRAMLDEAYRLAYVGATRGRRRVFWYVTEHPKGAAGFLSQALS